VLCPRAQAVKKNIGGCGPGNLSLAKTYTFASLPAVCATPPHRQNFCAVVPCSTARSDGQCNIVLVQR